MAFKKQKIEYQKEERIDLDNQENLKEIKEFEKELEPYFIRKCELFDGREISGFDLYLHNNMLYRYSPQYPGGAVILGNAEKYREAKKKYNALKDLWHRRAQAEKKEKERLQTLAI